MAAHFSAASSPDARQTMQGLPSSEASSSSDDEQHGGSLLLSLLDLPLPPGTKELPFGNHVPPINKDALTASFGFPAVPPRMRDSLTGGLRLARRSRQHSANGGSPPPERASVGRNSFQKADVMGMASSTRRKRTSSSRGSISPKKLEAKKLGSPASAASRLASPRTHPPKLHSPKSVDAGLRNLAAATGRNVPSGGARMRGASSVDAAADMDVFPIVLGGGKETQQQPHSEFESQQPLHLATQASSDVAGPSSDGIRGAPSAPSSLGLSWSSSQASSTSNAPSASGPSTGDYLTSNEEDEEGMDGLSASSEGADSSGAPVTPASPGTSGGGWTPRELTLGSTQATMTDRERERERMLVGLGIRSASSVARSATTMTPGEASHPQNTPFQLQTSGMVTAQRRPPRETQPGGPSPNLRTGGPRQLMLAPAGGPPGSNRTIAVTDAREVSDARSTRDPLRVSPRIPLASRSASAGPSPSGPSPHLAPRSALPVFQAPPLPSPLLGLGLRPRRGSSSTAGSVTSMGISMSSLAAPVAHSDGSISPVASAPSWEMTRGTSSNASGSVRGPSPVATDSVGATSSPGSATEFFMAAQNVPVVQEPQPQPADDADSDATPSLIATPSPSASLRVAELQPNESSPTASASGFPSTAPSRPLETLVRAGSFSETAFGRRPSTSRLAKTPPSPLNLARTPSTRSEVSRASTGLGINVVDSPRSEGPSEMSDAPEPVTAMSASIEGEDFEIVSPSSRDAAVPSYNLLTVNSAQQYDGISPSPRLAPPSPHSASSTANSGFGDGPDGFHTPSQSPAFVSTRNSDIGGHLTDVSLVSLAQVETPQVEITATSPISDHQMAGPGSDVSSQRTPQQATTGLLGSPPREALPMTPATAYFDVEEAPHEASAEPLLFRATAPPTEASSEASGPTSSVVGSTDSPARRFLGSIARDSTSSSLEPHGAFEFDEGIAEDADAAAQRRPSSIPSAQHPLSVSHMSPSSTRSSLFSQDSVLDQARDGSGLTGGVRSPDGDAKQTSADTSLGMSPSPSMQFNTTIFSGMTTSASKEDGIGPKNSWPPPPREQLFPALTPVLDGAAPVVPTRGSSARSRSGRFSAASNYARSSVTSPPPPQSSHSRATSRDLPLRSFTTGEDLSRQSSRLSGVDEDQVVKPSTAAATSALGSDRALTASPTHLSFTAPLPQEEWSRPPIRQRTSSQNLHRHARSTSNLTRDALNSASPSVTSSPIGRGRSKPSLKVDTATRISETSDFGPSMPEPVSARPRPSVVPDVPFFGYAPSRGGPVRTSSGMPPPMSATSTNFPASDEFGGMSSRWSSGSESEGEGSSSKGKGKNAASAKGKNIVKRGRGSNAGIPAMPTAPGGSIGRKSGGFLSGLGLRKKSFTATASAGAASSNRSNSPMTPGTGPTSPSIASEAYTEFPFPGFSAVAGEGNGLASAPDTPHSQLASRFSQSTTYSLAPSAKPSTSSLRHQYISGEASRRPSVSAASTVATDSPAANSPVRPVAAAARQAMGPPDAPQQDIAARLHGLGLGVNDAQKIVTPAPASKGDSSGERQSFSRGHNPTASTSSLRRRWEQQTTDAVPLAESRRPSRVDAPLPPPPVEETESTSSSSSTPVPTADSSATLHAKPAARSTTPPAAKPEVPVTASTPQRAPSPSLSDETPRVAYASLPASEASSPTTSVRPRWTQRGGDDDDDEDDGLEALGLSFIQRQASLRQPARASPRVATASPASSEVASSPLDASESIINAMPMPPPRPNAMAASQVPAPAPSALPSLPIRHARYNSLSDVGRDWVRHHPGQPLLAAKGPELRQAATSLPAATAGSDAGSTSDSGTDDYGSSDGGGRDDGRNGDLNGGGSGSGSGSGAGRRDDGDDDSDRPPPNKQPFSSGFDEDEEEEDKSDDYGGSEDEQLCSNAEGLRIQSQRYQEMTRSGTSSASDDAPLGGRVSDIEALQKRLREQERKAQVAHTASRLESGAKRQTDPSRAPTRKQRLPRLVQEAAPDSSPLNALDLISRLEKLAIQQKQKEQQARALAQTQGQRKARTSSNAAAVAVATVASATEGRTSGESQRSAVSSYQHHFSDSSHRPRQPMPTSSHGHGQQQQALRQATVPAPVPPPAMAQQALSRDRSLKQAPAQGPVVMQASSSATDPHAALRRQASSESMAKAVARGVYQPGGGPSSFQPPMAAMMMPKRSPVLSSDAELPNLMPASPAVSSAMAMVTAQAEAFEQARLNADLPGMNAAAAAVASAMGGNAARPRWPTGRAQQIGSSPLASSSDESFVTAHIMSQDRPAPANILPRSRARSNSRPRAPTMDTRVAPPMPANAAMAAAMQTSAAPNVPPSPAMSNDSSLQHMSAIAARRSPQAAFNELPSSNVSGSPVNVAPPTAVAHAAPTTQLVQHRVYVMTLQKYGTVLLPYQARARDLVTDVLDNGLVPSHEQKAGGWVVFDVCAELGIERPIREYEVVSEVVEARASASDYFMLKRTELAPYLSFRAVPSSSPVLGGYVYVQDAKKKWSKRWLELREHSLFHAKSEKGKDEQLICHLSGFDVYLVDQTKVKTPKAHSFAIRSQNKITMFEKPDQDYAHMFSLSDPAAHRDWVRAIMNARTYVLSRERAQLLNYRPRPTQAQMLQQQQQATASSGPPAQAAMAPQPLSDSTVLRTAAPSTGSTSLSRVTSGRRMPSRPMPTSDDAASSGPASARTASASAPLIDSAVVGPFAKGSLLADVAARTAPEMDLSLHERTRARMQAAARKAMSQEQERRARADGQPLLDVRR